MGMLALGVVLRNVPGDLLEGYKHSWETHIKAFGLATILFRAGTTEFWTTSGSLDKWLNLLDAKQCNRLGQQPGG